MLRRKISWNRVVSGLADDTSRMLFSWTIAHLDREGRIHGEPSLLRSIVAPRLNHITDEIVERCIQEWAAKDLVIWYEANGDRYIAFPRFHENQQGLRVDREAESNIPGPTPDLLRSNSGPTPDLLPPNVREGKGREENASRPVHMLLAESWFRAYSEKTARMVGPGPEDYLKAETVCARMEPKVAKSTIPTYFSGDFWFTRDKVTKKAAYSFGGWVAHIEELLASAPVKPKARGWACPKCGHLNTTSGATCMECHEEVARAVGKKGET